VFNWVKHGTIRAGGGADVVFDSHDGDHVVREAVVDLLVEGGLTEADGDGNEEALREEVGRGATGEVGVEFDDVG
jgi:hypothetical protein